MKLTIGEHAGFCFGVRRAVLKAFECAEKQLPCVTLGPLIHNPQEVERLKQAGIRSVDSLDEVASGETVIIRSHGVTPEVYAQCEARGIPVIDATCPHVAHIHQLVQAYSEDGGAVVIVGEADHPEVVGIAGWAHGAVFILPDAHAAEEADLPERAMVVAQTTIRRDRFESVLQVLRRRVPNLPERMTICAATSQRQQEAERLSAQADVMVVVAFGQILPKELLDIPKYGCVNVHASLLPKYRGAAPIQWAVIRGEKVSGVTTMQMDVGLDTGDMLLKAEVPLAEDETGGSLHDKLSVLGGDLLIETLKGLEAGTIVPEKQDDSQSGEYARMLDKSLGKIDFSMRAEEIERLIRGLNPWPSAYTSYNNKTMKLWKARVVPGGEAVPGQVLAVDKKGFTVQTGDGALQILELQMEGKKRMDTAAFLRGYPVETGVKLG